MKEPQELVPGTFTLRLRGDGLVCSSSFGSSKLRHMRSVHA